MTAPALVNTYAKDGSPSLPNELRRLRQELALVGINAQNGVEMPSSTQPVDALWDMLAVLVSIGALLVACVAAYIAWYTAREQFRLQTHFKEQEVAYSKRRFIVELWDKLTEVRKIEPKLHPETKVVDWNETHILNNLNILELVAVSWLTDLVDKDALALAFADNYIQRYDEIKNITEVLPFSRKTGPTLVDDRRLVGIVYERLRLWRENRIMKEISP